MLATPADLQKKEFDISLIVGADHYWDIVGDKIVRVDGPTAIARVFTHWASSTNNRKIPDANYHPTLKCFMA